MVRTENDRSPWSEQDRGPTSGFVVRSLWSIGSSLSTRLLLVGWFVVTSSLVGFGACRGADVTVDPKGICPFDWRAYPYQPAGSDILFPRDEGAHYTSDPAVTMEWWYTIFHVQSLSGRRFSIMTTFFMPQIDMSFRPFNLIDVDNAVRFDGGEWGELEAGQGSLDLVYVSDVASEAQSFFRNELDSQGHPIPFHYRQESFYVDPKDSSRTQSLQFRMEAVKEPFLVGGDGYVAIGDSGDSYYYSLTDLRVQGRLEINGQVFEVEGQGWMDHQWGPFMLSPLSFSMNHYEWIAVHLDNGQQYMVSSLFDRDNHLHLEEGFGSVGWVDADCSQGHTVDYRIDRLAYWKFEAKNYFFTSKWRVQVPETGLDVVIEPAIADQTVEFLGAYFYEGRANVSGTVQGVPVTGLAFTEMTHHFEAPQVLVTSPADGSVVQGATTASWQVTNPDDGLPLTFTVTLDQGGDSKVVCDHVQGTSCSVDFSSYRGSVGVTVTASSVDETIQSTAQVEVSVGS